MSTSSPSKIELNLFREKHWWDSDSDVEYDEMLKNTKEQLNNEFEESMIATENRRKTNTNIVFKLQNQLNQIQHQNKAKREKLKRLKEQSADVNDTVILETSFTANMFQSAVLSPRQKKLLGGVDQTDLDKIQAKLKNVSMKMLEVDRETDQINYRLAEQKKQNLSDKTKKHDLAYLHQRVTKNIDSITNAQRTAQGFHIQSINSLKSARDSYDKLQNRFEKNMGERQKERDIIKRDINSATANISRAFHKKHWKENKKKRMLSALQNELSQFHDYNQKVRSDVRKGQKLEQQFHLLTELLVRLRKNVADKVETQLGPTYIETVINLHKDLTYRERNLSNLFADLSKQEEYLRSENKRCNKKLKRLAEKFISDQQQESDLFKRANNFMQSIYKTQPVDTLNELIYAIDKLENKEFQNLKGFDFTYIAYGHFMELVAKITQILGFVQFNVMHLQFDLQATQSQAKSILETFRLGFLIKKRETDSQNPLKPRYVQRVATQNPTRASIRQRVTQKKSTMQLYEDYMSYSHAEIVEIFRKANKNTAMANLFATRLRSVPVLQFFISDEDILLFLHSTREDVVGKLPELLVSACKNLQSKFGAMNDVVTSLMRKIRETGDKNRIEINNAKLKREHQHQFDSYLKTGMILDMKKFTSVFNEATKNVIAITQAHEELTVNKDNMEKIKAMHKAYDSIHSRKSDGSPSKKSKTSIDQTLTKNTLPDLQMRRSSQLKSPKIVYDSEREDQEDQTFITSMRDNIKSRGALKRRNKLNESNMLKEQSTAEDHAEATHLSRARKIRKVIEEVTDWETQLKKIKGMERFVKGRFMARGRTSTTSHKTLRRRNALMSPPNMQYTNPWTARSSAASFKFAEI